MNLPIIFTLVKKDLKQYFSNRFFALISLVGLAMYVAVFFLLPKEVDETITLGWYSSALPVEITSLFDEENVVINEYPDVEALKAAVLEGDEVVGVSLPVDFMQKLQAGEKPSVSLFIKSDLPDDYRAVYNLMMEELSFMLTGQGLNVEAEEIVLGKDMAGMQIAPRFRMLPILAVVLLTFECMGLASLITGEMESGTARALLVTPLKPEGFFTSKAITGVSLAFIQAVFLLIITGGLRQQPALILVALLLGSLLVTGLSFLVASLARDLMSVIAWGMLVMIVFIIPAFNVMLPGLASDWIKAIPSYYLVDIIHQVINFDAGWSQMQTNLMLLSAFTVVFLGLGVAALRRRLS